MSLLRRLTGAGRRDVRRRGRAEPPPHANAHAAGHFADGVAEIASLAGQRRYADAYALANGALARAPGDTALLFAKGSALLDWGRFRESRAAYEEAERNGMRSVALYRQLGWACLLGRDLEAAESHLRTAVSIDAKNFEAQ